MRWFEASPRRAASKGHKSFIFRTAPFPEAVPTTNSLSCSGHKICDNYATHKTPAIQKWLLAHPRFHMHFTPTSSSWLNQVERWFGLLTDKRIRRGVHKNVQALEKDIRDWIAHWNEDPKPFTWTKSADEIFERLAGYLNRLPSPEPKL
jgi:hypothetical protein